MNGIEHCAAKMMGIIPVRYVQCWGCREQAAFDLIERRCVNSACKVRGEEHNTAKSGA